MKIITKILIGALALLAAAYLIPGVFVESFYIAVIAAIILGVFNVIIKPILIILTLPVNLLTLGLFTFVINAALFAFAASFIQGFSVDGFIPALFGSLLVSVITTIGNKLT